MDGRIGVLFLIHQAGPASDGGVESITQVIERARGIRAVIVTQRDTRYNARWIAAGAAVHVWPRPIGSRAGFVPGVLRSNARMFRFARTADVSVLHCNDVHSLLRGGIGGRLAGLPLVFNVRAVKKPGASYGAKWMLANLGRRIVVLSDEMQDQLRRRLPLLPSVRRRIRRIYSAAAVATDDDVTANDRGRLRAERGIPKDQLAIAYVAAFKPVKGQLPFIEEAGPRIRAELPHAHVYFVGDFEPEVNPYAASCRAAVQRLGMSDLFTFVGYTSAVREWYRAADVTVVASEREGLARCMIESLATATPVVSFDVCSAREILEVHDCGRVVPSGDYASLVRSLGSMCDATERDRLASNGTRVARSLFDPVAVTGEYEKLWREVTSETRDGALRAGR